MGGTRLRKTRKNARNRSLKKLRQKGGYYPSVFEGIRNAAILMPAVARQVYNMWKNSKRLTRKKRINKKYM